MPKRSWVTLLSAWTFSLLWSVLALLRAEPNNGLVQYLGYADYDQVLADASELHRYSSALLRHWSISQIALAVFVLVIVLIPYRHGRRWAWAALWTVPVANAAAFWVDATGFPGGPSDTGTLGVLYLVEAAVFAVGLILGAGRVRHRLVADRSSTAELDPGAGRDVDADHRSPSARTPRRGGAGTTV